MLTNETRGQDSAVVTIAGDNAGVIDDTLDWGESFTEYDRYSELTGHSYVRCPVCGVKVLGDETSTASHRPAYRRE